MATAPVVVTAANNGTPAVGGLFNGSSFFLTQRIPQRARFVQDVQHNGGRVVRLEQQADYVIADHMRPDAPEGSISFTFIDAAIKTGQLPDPKDHPAGRAGTQRPVGSAVPTKATRTPFTAADDEFLYRWVQDRGGAVRGNELYKELERVNPRHTYQSWRDRYIKRLESNPPKPVDKEEFSEEEWRMVMNNAEDIEDIPPENVEGAWQAFAGAFRSHSATSWRLFYELDVRPRYLEERNRQEQGDPAARNGDNVHRIGLPQNTTDDLRPPSIKSIPADAQETGASSLVSPSRQKSPPTGYKRKFEPARSIPSAPKRRRSDVDQSDNQQQPQTQSQRSLHTSVQQLLEAPPESITPSAKDGNDRDINDRHIEESADNDQGKLPPMDNEGKTDTGDPGLRHNREIDFMKTNEAVRQPLTEANIVRQQSQTFQPSVRALDLPEDDDVAAQADMISMLQDSLPAPGDARFSLLSPRAAMALEEQRSAAPVKGANGDVKKQWYFADAIQDTDTRTYDLDRIFEPPLSLVREGHDAVDQLHFDEGTTLPDRNESLNNIEINSENNLSVVEPEEGYWPPSSPPKETRPTWQIASNSAGKADDAEPPANFGPSLLRAKILETQDILNAETQHYNFSIPPPPISESDEDFATTVNSQQQAREPQRNAADSQEVAEEDFETYFNKMLVRGFDEISVFNALMRTSNRPELADLILVEQKAGHGLPIDVPGIWSEEDDGILEGGNQKLLEELEAKHTWEECEKRMLFLSSLREAQDDDHDHNDDE